MQQLEEKHNNDVNCQNNNAGSRAIEDMGDLSQYDRVGFVPDSAKEIAVNLFQAASMSKEILDGAYLSISVENHFADLLSLNQFITDDKYHSARLYPSR